MDSRDLPTQPGPQDDQELSILAAARRAARLAHDEATVECARLESLITADAAITERLLCAQDRVIASRDRVEAARDRYEAARDRRASALDRRLAAAYLERSYRDELTGVLQRRAGHTELQNEVDRVRRDNQPLVVVFIDVDGLKHVNDTQGHLAGDEVLRTVGQALRDGLRSYDVAMRFGGDEFVCGLPGADAAEARQRFEALQERCRALHPDASVSFGIASLRPDESMSDAIRRADKDLYATRALRSLAPQQPDRSS